MLAPSTYSLAPYSSVLKREDLLHLLRRCLFGVGHKELKAFEGKSLEQVMQVLLKQSPMAPPPVQDDPDRDDPLVPKGKLWVKAPYEDEFVDKSRRDALKGWIAGQMLMRDNSVTEKMKLFWRNHFVTETDVVNDARYSYTYSQLLHQHALGNFKELIIEGTGNPAMLVYLNGNSNNKNAPNENYARELMELFTLGKGYGVSYTEEDVRTASRVLTGWVDDKTTVESTFNPELHDTGSKKFSSYFDNHVLEGKSGEAGKEEVRDLVDMLLKKDEAARFVCRNLYRWFLCHEVSEQAEAEVIAPLAKQLKENGFEVLPVLRTLLSSQHFFDPAFRGCMVKSPVDFFVGAAQQFELAFPEDDSAKFLNHIYFYFTMLAMLMAVGDPPSVSGWPAYYQPPKFGLWWINSHTLGQRKAITDGLASEEGTACNGPVLKFEFLPFVKQFSQPGNVDLLMDEVIELTCAVRLSEATRARLKAILLKEIKTEQEWEKTWAASVDHSTLLETSLRGFFKKLLTLPEYHMM